MKNNVRVVAVYLGDKRVDPSELSSLVITSPTVHRIFNRVVERVERQQAEMSEPENSLEESQIGPVLQ